eukprot:TRINITY_DN14965_c0_g2_i1.p1 TRINITY_DN14965_c0_g2~~TRINITY_DN14965_c0_g2_i1.p1  ORF type:complete len:468 (+),score=62.87 TRINITY_DN14965_c0_g2_i1:791-2194(+)
MKWVSVRASIAETLGLQEFPSKIPPLKLPDWSDENDCEDPEMGFGQTIDLGLDLQIEAGKEENEESPSRAVSLKQMIEELDCSDDVPSVFICPISLEPMQDPVTLCTGQTYERSNILQWFSIGQYICPTTMQKLWDVTLTPNRTLFHLIYKWFSHRFVIQKKDVQGRVKDLLERLTRAKGQARIQALSALRLIAQTDESGRKTIVDEGGVMLLSSLLGPFTSHLVGAEAIGILVRLPLDQKGKTSLTEPAKISLMVDLLHEGTIETRINSAKLIETLIDMEDLQSENVSCFRLLFGLLKLVKDRRHPRGIAAALSLLRIICCCTQVRSHMVSIGLVSQLIELLPHTTTTCLETALSILDTLSTLQAGRDALKDCSCTIPNIVRVLMRLSENSKQHALSILWTVCKLAPEECTSTAVEAGIATKLLLVIQSSCNPVVKQRSTELLKLCSLNYTATIFISKCNLTRTIQ